MKINIVPGGRPKELLPLTCTFEFEDIPVCGRPLQEQLQRRFAAVAAIVAVPDDHLMLSLCPALFPSDELWHRIAAATAAAEIVTPDGEVLGWINETESRPRSPATITIDAASRVIRYPWDILAVNEEIVGSLATDDIRGELREGVVIDGRVAVGAGTVLLPGVYIEGNAVIGRNVKLGPNCYLRGNTYIGDNCHIGQAVEVKNSLLMRNVSAGHLSYIGDSVVGPDTNFGAGTITSNFRHDGCNHRSMVNGELIDTGRRKFGAIIGAGVHTGIHTAIYPGRKIWAGMSTRPGDIVQRDLRPEHQE
ncbi:MAG: hypothetical protein PHQ27_01735 [Victivallales bacterium]|nr:hypothetical protein [Victivallales bacterium]